MSAAALKEAHLRHHRALVTAHGDGSGRGVKVTISGRTYEAAVSYGRTRHSPLADGSGWEKVQDITLAILKSALPAMPAKKTTITIADVDYLITDAAGQGELAQSWIITAQRRM